LLKIAATQPLNMKMALGVAVVAALLGGTIAGLGVETVKNHLLPIGAGAAAVFVAYCLLKMLKLMKQMKDELHWISEKCRYIEKRIDAAAAKSGDVCRHLQQVFLEFDADLNQGQTMEMKWWWVERRLRQLYEDFSNCKAMEKCSYGVAKKTWSMLQLEVKMRRDTVAYRHFAEPLGEDDEDMEWALKNMNEAMKYCFFWKPMQLSELEQHTAESCYEELLMSQIGERVNEVKKSLEVADMKNFQGLELEGFLGGSSFESNATARGQRQANLRYPSRP
jgi:hypothetical protein